MRDTTLGAYFSAQPPAVTPPFVNPTDHVAGGSFTKAVAVGDITNDGRPDLLGITSVYFDPTTENKLLVATQKSDGTFNDIAIYSTIDAAPTGLAILDATGDGKLDAVIGTGNGVEIHAQNAAGGLDTGVAIPGAPGVSDLTAADIDGDGDQDIVASGVGVYLLTQGPAGSFSSTRVATVDQGYGETEVGDLNSDGRLDIASFGPISAPTVAVHLNTPDGWTHTNYSIDSSPYGIEVADVTGDGRADLVSVTPYTVGPNTLDVFKQQANGTLVKSQSVNVPWGPTGVESADWDRDGRTDLVVGTDGGPTKFLRQQVDGTLAAGIDTPPKVAQWPDADCLVLADLNGDSYPDVVAARDFGAGFLAAYNSVGTPPAPGIVIPLGPQDWVRSTNIADFSVGVLRSKVTITMQVALDPATVNGQTVKLVNGKTGVAVPLTVHYDASTRTISLYRTVTTSNGSVKYLPVAVRGGVYRLVIGGVRDTDGRTNPGYSFSFTG